MSTPILKKYFKKIKFKLLGFLLIGIITSCTNESTDNNISLP